MFHACTIRFTVAATLAVFAGTTAPVALGQNTTTTIAAKPMIKPGAPAAATAPTTAAGAKPFGGEARAEKKVKVSDSNLVELHVKDEDLAGVLELMANQGQRNIVVSNKVSGKVTMNLFGVTFYEALDALLHSNGFAYVEKGNFIYVYTLEELEKLEKTFKKKVAKLVKLNYLNAVDAAEFVKGALSKDGEIKTPPKTEGFNIPNTSPVGADTNAMGAMLVITDYEENIKAIEALLGELDTKPSQVLIEATVLQTKLTEENAFGVDFSIIGGVNFSDFAAVTAGPRGVVDALIAGGASASTGVTNPGTNTAASSTVGGTSGRGGFKAGIISNNVGVFVRLLDEITDTTVLANPKLLTLNRQPSRVLVGRRVAYLSTTATETSTTQTVQYLDTGVQLYVRPFVSASGDIRMEIKPQVSTADIKDIKAAGGGTVTVPDEVTQEVVTNIIVPDGMTVVIGGLFTETTVAGRSQIPGLGDLPLIGAAFKGQNDSTSRDEIIFLVTPSVVSDKTLVTQSEQARGVEDHLRSGARQGLLPWSREKRASELNVEAQRAAQAGEHAKALMLINSSLAIKPQNEDALRLRDRILGDREIWPSNSLLEGVVGTNARDRVKTVVPPAQKPSYSVPMFRSDMPRQPVPQDDKHASLPPALQAPVNVDAKLEELLNSSANAAKTDMAAVPTGATGTPTLPPLDLKALLETSPAVPAAADQRQAAKPTEQLPAALMQPAFPANPFALPENETQTASNTGPVFPAPITQPAAKQTPAFPSLPSMLASFKWPTLPAIPAAKPVAKPAEPQQATVPTEGAEGQNP